MSFRVIPVIDIQNGVVVHAQGGDRRGYKPFASSCVSENPDAVAVATSLRDRFGFREVYLADLDAIGSGRPSSAVLPRLLELEIKVIADLGIKDQVDFCSLPSSYCGTSLILATETLGGAACLDRLVQTHPAERFIFGLDFRNGTPLVAAGSDWGSGSPAALVQRASAAGLNHVLLLDLAKVGTGAGNGLFPLVERLLLQNNSLEIFVGGGIAGIDEIVRWKAAGVSGVLVGSALHGGQIVPSDLARLRS